MDRLRNAASVLAAGTIFATFLWFSAKPRELIIGIPIIAGVAVATSAILCFIALKRRAPVAPGAFPCLLVGSLTLANLFVEDANLRIGLALVTAVLFYILTRYIYEFIVSHGFTQALSALSEWSAAMIIFGSTSGLLAAVTFLGLNIWLATLIFAVVCTFVSLALANLTEGASFAIAGVVALVIIEGFAVLAMLPISYWVCGGVLIVVSYLLFSLTRAAEPSRMRRSVLFACALCLILLITARWK